MFTARSCRIARFPVLFNFNTGIPAAKVDLYKTPEVSLNITYIYSCYSIENIFYKIPVLKGGKKKFTKELCGFDVHVTVHRDKFLKIKPTRCTNFSNLFFWYEALHVSDSSSFHHQEFFTVHTAMVYVTQVCLQLVSRSICSCSQAVSKLV